MNSPENSYLGEVLEQQAKVDAELKRKVRNVASQMPTQAPGPQAFRQRAQALAVPADEGRGVDYRITGWFRWRTVVVPPNAYVVHTRRGHEKPLHLGMGISFRYNPNTDAFLVIPAAVQTLIINARCICAERQGILVQAYVQWIIGDLETAYRRLDFSDPEDPMRLVNVQLREQAEAAIKDKVATLRIDEVLADKQPIIEELTLRLRGVAEGGREGQSGLGLKIVTVQIKEAVVSSTRLWENLQKPFRAERAKLARMAELEAENQIQARELENRRARDMAEVDAERELEKVRATQEQENYDRAHAEKIRRHKLEQASEQQEILERNATEMARREAELALALKELDLARSRIQQEISSLELQRQLDTAQAARARAAAEEEAALAGLRSQAARQQAERELATFAERRRIENELSDGLLRSQLVSALPEIAAKLPAPAELRTVSISSEPGGPASSLAGLLASLLGVLELGRKDGAARPPASNG